MGIFDSIGDLAGGAASAVSSGWSALNGPSVEDVQRQRQQQFALANDQEKQRLLAQWQAEGSGLLGTGGPLGAGALFKSLIPQPALDVVGSAPIIGGEAERIISGMTSPFGLGLTLATAGAADPIAALIFGTAGAMGGGLAGQAAEKLGVPDLKLPTPFGPLNISPQTIGELGGGIKGAGFKGFGGAADTATQDVAREMSLPKPTAPAGMDLAPVSGPMSPVTTGVASASDKALMSGSIKAHVDAVSNFVSNARDMGISVDPAVTADTFHLAAQISDEPLHTFDPTAQMRTGVTDPPALETTFGKLYDGFKSGMRDSGTLSWTPAPARQVFGVIAPSTIVKAGTADWVYLTHVDAVNRIWNGANYAVQPLLAAEKEAGGFERGSWLQRTMGGNKLPLTDQPVAGDVGANGLIRTWKNMIERPSSFTPSPQEQQVVDYYNGFTEAVYNAGVQALKNAGKTPAEIADIAPPRLDGYFHRLLADDAGGLANSPARYKMGAKQTMQSERAPEGTVDARFVDSPTLSAQAYATEMGQTVAWNTVWGPLMKSYGVTDAGLRPPAFDAALSALRGQRDWLTSAQQLARDARSEGTLAPWPVAPVIWRLTTCRMRSRAKSSVLPTRSRTRPPSTSRSSSARRRRLGLPRPPSGGTLRRRRKPRRTFSGPLAL